ncbi:MAG: OsmC family protein [Deltaproteobacteria bacterium]|nr:OsmC family protein [Deltaproteobacteria bacterium]
MTMLNGLELEKLGATVEGVKQNWTAGKTVWKANTKWKGGFKVWTCSRDFTLLADEPEMLCGTDTAANPVEMVLQAYGACLTIGYAMNAAARGIELEDINIDLEGEIDLPGFLGLEPPEELNMDKLPGYKNIKATVKIKGKADAQALQDLHEHVIKTSPVGVTLSRPVAIETKLEVQ